MRKMPNILTILGAVFAFVLSALYVLRGILGWLGDFDTICGIFGILSDHCAARVMLTWVTTQTWISHVVYPFALIMMYLGESRSRRDDWGVYSKNFEKRLEAVSKEFAQLQVAVRDSNREALIQIAEMNSDTQTALRNNIDEMTARLNKSEEEKNKFVEKMGPLVADPKGPEPFLKNFFELQSDHLLFGFRQEIETLREKIMAMESEIRLL